jgi:hypothetical protein
VKSDGIVVPSQFLCTMGIGRFSSFDIGSVDPDPEVKLDKARIIHRSYSLLDEGDATANWVVILKEQRQIYKLHGQFCHLAYSVQHEGRRPNSTASAARASGASASSCAVRSSPRGGGSSVVRASRPSRDKAHRVTASMGGIRGFLLANVWVGGFK